jgi:hypothetical protein
MIPLGVRPLGRQIYSETLEQNRQVSRPAGRDGGGPDRILEDQVPSDDPRDQLAHRHVGIRIRAAGHRDHRGELRIAERSHRAGKSRYDERDDDRGSCVFCGGDAGQHENSRTDDRADSQQREI